MAMTTHTTDEEHLVPLNGFGGAIKTARLVRGWTQVYLAQEARVNTETIHRIERGLNTRVSTMQKIRRVLPEIAAPNGQLTAQQTEHLRQTALLAQHKTDLETLRDQVIYLIRAVADTDQLERIRRYALGQLTTATKTRRPRR